MSEFLLSGLHRRRSAADARVHHRRATEHHPGRVDVPVLLLKPDAQQIVIPRTGGWFCLSPLFGGVAAVCRNTEDDARQQVAEYSRTVEGGA